MKLGSNPMVREQTGWGARAVSVVVLGVSFSLVGVSGGCENAGQGAVSGAAIGALSGLAIGSLTGSAGAGAAIGAVSGAVGGAVIGDQNERRSQGR